MQTGTRFNRMMLRVLILSSSLVPAFIGILSILSWATDNVSIISISSGYVPIVPSTSVSIILLSLGMYACAKNKLRPVVKWMAVASIIAVIIINLWIVSPFQPDLEDLIDPLNENVNGYPLERASPITLFATLCSGFAMLLLIFRLHERSKLLGQTLTMLALIPLSIGILTTTGYLYGNPLLYGQPIKPVALLAAVSFLFLGMGAIVEKGPNSWPLRVFIGPSVRARLLRVFFPTTVIIIMAEGLVLIMFMPESTNPNHAVVTSSVAFITAILMGLLISRISRQLGMDIDRTNQLLIKTGEELQRANERLKVLDSITRHDSLNQLTILMGRLGILKSSIKDKQIGKLIDDPLKAAESIEAILLFAKDYQTIGVEEPSWVDVTEAFQNAVEVVRIPETVKVKAECAGLQIFADNMLGKVFFNLLDNSMRYGEKVKNIGISCHRQWGGGLLLRYKDDGVGIASEDKPRLFQRGFGKHTGLGLFLSKEILGYTGLTITEKGEHGKGVLFEISVPEGKYKL